MFSFIQNIDDAIFKFVNSSMTHPMLDSFFPWLTGLQNDDTFRYRVLPILLGVFILILRMKMVRAILAIICVLIVTDSIGSRIFKPLFNRTRPNNQIEQSHSILRIPYGPQSGSFPSNHSMNSFAVATVLVYYFPLIAFPVFFIAVLSGYARIYVGVHYPTDVIIGAMLGIAIAILVLKLLNYIPLFRRIRGL